MLSTPTKEMTSQAPLCQARAFWRCALMMCFDDDDDDDHDVLVTIAMMMPIMTLFTSCNPCENSVLQL